MKMVVMRRSEILWSAVTKLRLGTAELRNESQIHGISIFLSAMSLYINYKLAEIFR
jgi:hypothetical protein